MTFDEQGKLKPGRFNGMITELTTALPESEDDLFEMANLSPKRTGVPFVVWISPRAGAQHDVRVKVSRGPKAKSGEFISVALRPDLHVSGGGQLTYRNSHCSIAGWP